ncbi:MAG: hypothetical protein ACR2PH_06700 [Desulfobulbia bacterium]
MIKEIDVLIRIILSFADPRDILTHHLFGERDEAGSTGESSSHRKNRGFKILSVYS